jgi:hypothetical protein
MASGLQVQERPPVLKFARSWPAVVGCTRKFPWRSCAAHIISEAPARSCNLFIMHPAHRSALWVPASANFWFCRAPLPGLGASCHQLAPIAVWIHYSGQASRGEENGR